MKALIYKITSPKKRVYIGQTINFKDRLQVYKRLDCKKQKKLYNSFLKYGFDNHKIEVICYCSPLELNDLERYYQDLYCSNNKFGLNIRLTKSNDRSGTFSEETKKKMSLSKIGTKRSKDVSKAISIRMKKLASERDKEYYKNFSNCNKGRKHTKSHIEKNSKAKKGNTFRLGAKHKESSKLKISEAKKGKKFSEETKEKMKISAINAWKKRKKNE